MGLFVTLAIIFVAIIVTVPISRRLGLGNVIGYLAAGILIGPAGFNLVADYEEISHVAELGIVMLLFLIGLEIRPQRLWTMRKMVFGLGLGQIVATAAAIAAVPMALGLMPWNAAVLVGLGLALSSTALVLPMLSDWGLINKESGRMSFSVLLMQDVAVIPILAAVPLLAGDMGEEPLPMEDRALGFAIAIATIVALYIAGRYLIRYLFRFLHTVATPELMTAAALFVVLGTAALVAAVGLSMSLGAFLAGVLLSQSEFRHELQASIEPFEGLLLGLFFVSVGMAAELGLLLSEPLLVLGLVAGLVVVKLVLAGVLALASGADWKTALRVGVILSQGGEFGFVLFAAAAEEGVLGPTVEPLVFLVIALSMLTTPALMLLVERLFRADAGAAESRPYDEIDAHSRPVIIIGFNRIGQILGRVLRVRRIPFTALERDLGQVDFVRRFGNEVYYGDAKRVDLLRAAGADDARLVVVALEEKEESLAVVETLRTHFPDLRIIAVAATRDHAHRLMEQGVVEIIRATYFSSLTLTQQVLQGLGMSAKEAKRTVDIFREHDEKALKAQYEIRQDPKKIIAAAQALSAELEELFLADSAVEEEDADKKQKAG